MPRSQKLINLLGVTIPFVAFLASMFFLWGNLVTPRDLTILAVGYLLTCLGISIGFHRLFTQRARGARLDGRAGAGDPLGLRPPQAPQLRRP
jgi:fatty-acid desaturase